MTFRTQALRLIFLAVITPVLFLLGCQSKLIYYQNSYNNGDGNSLGAVKGQRIAYETGQGKQKAYYIPAKTARPGGALPEVVWLTFGGNGALALDWLHLTPTWDSRFAYLLIDYPGYGECEGRPNPARIRENAQTAVTALAKHLNVAPEELRPRLAVLGHSLGCAAGLVAANDQGIQRLVLVAPFTTMTEMAKRVLGWPFCYLNMHRFDNRKQLKTACDNGARVVLLHGTEDEVIPISMSRELAKANPDQVTLHECEGASHNDILADCAGEIGLAMKSVAKPSQTKP